MLFFDENEFRTRSAGIKCMVIGDIILDSYLYGDVSRISPEAPIPVVKISARKKVLGGAANVAGNIRGYGQDVVLIGKVGDDENGKSVLELLRQKEIDFRGSLVGSTIQKTRIIGKNQQMLRLDEEEDEWVTPDEQDEFLTKINGLLEEIQVVLFSDYKKGVCTSKLCSEIIRAAKSKNIKVIVDPKSDNWEKYRGADIVAPNFSEFCEALHKKLANTDEAIADGALKLISMYGINGVLVTRSEKGMLYIGKGREIVPLPTLAQEVFDVSGAGDTVVSTIAAFLAVGYPISIALKAANIAAGISVGKMGTYAVALNEVVDYCKGIGADIKGKIINLEELAALSESWKSKQEKIIFTNGCFDIIHAGHIHYLKKASELGNKLIIGLNSDNSVKRLKGDKRPINTQDNRALLLSALEFVDYIVVFNEDTPIEIIKKLQPDILVKGGDYTPKEVVGTEFAGETMIIPYLEGFSSTEIINKIKG